LQYLVHFLKDKKDSNVNIDNLMTEYHLSTKEGRPFHRSEEAMTLYQLDFINNQTLYLNPTIHLVKGKHTINRQRHSSKEKKAVAVPPDGI
jgi:hypothetical protein